MDEERLDDRFAELLARYDEALVEGQLAAEQDSQELAPDLQEDLKHAEELLHLIESVWPRGGRTGVQVS